MNKFLNISRFIILMFTIVVNLLALKNGISMLGWNHILYLFLLFCLLIINFNDIRFKNKICNNKMYNILSILIFTIISLIILRALFDNRFVVNDADFMKNFDNYYSLLYGKANWGYEFEFFPDFYVAQNIDYFISLLFLLISYRGINCSRKFKKLN